jgi:hypothetical protein
LVPPAVPRPDDHRGEIVGKATWPAIIDRATHDRQLVRSVIDQTNPTRCVSQIDPPHTQHAADDEVFHSLVHAVRDRAAIVPVIAIGRPCARMPR